MFVDNDGIEIADPTVSSCGRFEVASPCDYYGRPFITAVLEFVEKPWSEIVSDYDMWNTIATYQDDIEPPFDSSFDEPENEQWLEENRAAFVVWVCRVLLFKDGQQGER